MTRTLLPITLLASIALAPAALAAQQPEQAKLDVTGSYLYINDLGNGQKQLSAVFETENPIERRHDGAIKGGVKIAGSQSSIGAVKKGASIYTGGLLIKNGKVSTVVDGAVVKKAAKVGAKFKIEVFLRDGQKVTKTLTVRAEKAGDDTGKPLAG